MGKIEKAQKELELSLEVNLNQEHISLKVMNFTLSNFNVLFYEIK